jgi:mannose-6-phosphate isomerase-like protein (cupin superfamily)
MRYTRMYADAAGETHFGDVAVALAPVDYAPPAPPVQLAAYTDATRFTFVAAPAGWFGDAHPSPRRQLFAFLAGTWEVTMSDGEVRRFRPGDAVLVEDTTGRGHTTRVVGDAEGRALIVHLPD